MVQILMTPGSQSNPLAFKKEDNTFYGSERDIRFDTSYEVKNVTTGKSEIFDFKQSTGPEFDPDTKWLYESKSGIKLVIGNDPRITKASAKAYLDHKLNRD